MPWAPAIPLFYCFAIRMVAGNYTTLLDLAIKAAGNPERSLKILSVWTLWEWLVALAAITVFGYAGIAVSSAFAIWIALLWLYRDVSHRVPLDLRSTSTPLLAGALTFVTLHFGKGQAISNLLDLLLFALVGVAVYALFAFLLEGRTLWIELHRDFRRLLSSDSAASVSGATG